MRKTRESLAAADFVLLVIEAQSPIQRQDFQILEEMDLSKTILIVNKIDLNEGKAPLLFTGEMADIERVMVSAKRGDGLDKLKKLLVRRCQKAAPFQIEDNIVASARHKEALEGALACFNAARAKLEEGGGEELVSLDLNQGLSFLGHITGDRLGDEVLDEIFNKFCIGK
jgi:tRNA modification GTPase